MQVDRNLVVPGPEGRGLPAWVPGHVRDYFAHIVDGYPLREVARSGGGHASTILRRVRRLEQRRDDPLVDEALNSLEAVSRRGHPANNKGSNPMMMQKFPDTVATDAEIAREGRRILRRLCESGAFMVVAARMEKAAIMRETADGKPVRIAVLERRFARAFALRDWVENTRRGKINVYRLTAAGKSALKRLLAEEQARPGAPGFSPDPDPFRAQHAVPGERDIHVTGYASARRMRVNLGESPVTALARRKGRDGRPFLGADLVAAAERLREDFEMAQMGPRITQNWDRFLTGGRNGTAAHGISGAAGPMAARARVAEALRDLGPGLGDIALRCCCYLEGMEAAEKSRAGRRARARWFCGSRCSGLRSITRPATAACRR